VFPAVANGWVEIELDTPFEYDPTMNLAIAVNNTKEGLDSAAAPNQNRARGANDVVNRSWIWRDLQNHSRPDLDNIHNAQGIHYAMRPDLPNMRFTFDLDLPPAPESITLLTPENLATDVPLRPLLTWQAPSVPVTGYRIYLSDSPNPSANEANHVHTAWAQESWQLNFDLELQKEYYWQVIAFNDGGVSPPSHSFRFQTTATSSESDQVAVNLTTLLGNFPNPFNPETSIRFNVASAEHITINIYNTRGQLVRSLVNGAFEQGVHTAIWNGRDDNGNHVSSGYYLYKMRSGDFAQTRRMILIK